MGAMERKIDRPDGDDFPDEPGVFDIIDEEALAARDAAAWEDYLAGRFVSNEAVMRWLASWGTDNPLPPPKCGE